MTEAPRERPDYALLDRAGAAAAMFYPGADPYPPPEGASDLLIAVDDRASIGARFYPHDASRPTLLYFHGNGEVASDHDGIAPLYHAIGVNLFVAEFRGYGRSTGTPTLASMIGDAHAVAASFHETLDRLGFAPERLVMGRSLGTHPALELAAHAARPLRGLIVESGAGNLRRMLERMGLLDTEAGGRLAAAHEAKVASIRVPALLIHGESDELVPLSSAFALRDGLTGCERTLVTIPGAGHNDLLWAGRDRYFEAIEEFVRRVAG